MPAPRAQGVVSLVPSSREGRPTALAQPRVVVSRALAAARMEIPRAEALRPPLRTWATQLAVTGWPHLAAAQRAHQRWRAPTVMARAPARRQQAAPDPGKAAVQVHAQVMASRWRLGPAPMEPVLAQRVAAELSLA
jgi:hypothetical protein